MAIVKMKHLRLIGFAEDRAALMAGLLRLGSVEVTEPDHRLSDPEWAALVRRDTSELNDVRVRASGLSSALDALDKYAPIKKGLFLKRDPITEKAFFDDAALAGAENCAAGINASVREIAKCLTRENKINAAIAGLTPWETLDLPLEMRETASTEILPGVCPSGVELSALMRDLADAAQMAHLELISEDKNQKYLLLVCHRTETEAALNALRGRAFSVVHFKDTAGTAAENIIALRAELEQLAAARESEAKKIAACADERKNLRVCLDRMNQEIAKQLVRERFLTDGTVFLLEGWIPAENVPELELLLRPYTCARELEDPVQGDAVPTKLKNPKWMESINMVTEMYSLPAYSGIDPNPLMFFWYVFFFGFMFADVAYGLIIFLVSLAVIKIYNPKDTMGRMFHLGMWLGGSTAFCGIFLGGFFGNLLEVLYQNFISGDMPGWMATFCSGIVVNPIQDPMTVLIIAIGIGCVQLIMGQCIHIYMGFRDGTGADALLDVVPWWIVFAGVACIAVLGTPWVLAAGFLVLLLTQGRHALSLPGKIAGGLKSWYDITSWLSDVLSYARLMALMLATSVIAMVFNTLGALPRNIIVFALVFVIGHVFNIGVNLIGTYVHAARLQYLEYFGKFYISGGIPFRPLRYDTKYVDIVNTKEDN